MSINKAEKRTIGVACLAVLGFGCMRLLHDPIESALQARDMLFVSAFLEYAIVAFCFGIVLLGWTFFVRSLTRHRLYTAGLFTIVGMLELGHALTFYGMPFYREIGELSLTMLFGAAAQVLGAVGLFFIFRMPESRALGSIRRRMLLLSVTGGAIAITIVLAAAELGGDTLFEGGLLQVLRMAALAVILIGYAATAGTILYRHRSDRPQALLTIVQALCLLWFANVQVIVADSTIDPDMLIAQLFKAAGYFFLMKGIYLVTIEGPHRQQKRAEAQIQYLAYHDDLTGLGNRRLLGEKLAVEVNRAARHGTTFAVMLLDMDRFKTINDSLGHSFGDRLLAMAAERLRSVIAPSTHVYRMGGDEFTILLPDIRGEAEAEAAASAVMSAFAKPILLEGAEYHVTVSIGIAVYPAAGDTPDLLLQHADAALYGAKADRNTYRIYTPAMSEKAYDRLRLEHDLRRAIDEQQFKLVYQPLVELESGVVVGAEALIRWEHPQRGLINPAEFIPITEENGMIVELGEWVLREACRQNKAWQDAGLPPIIISVNLSVRQFRQHDLALRVRDILRETGLSAEYLELEITESMTADIEYAYDTLCRLKDVGIRISMDDFGTGYSSLSYLKRYPIDKLKIDRSFVMELSGEGSDAAIVSSITSMARHLNMRVTAEGVENEEQVDFLRGQRCEEAQGYFFTKPIPAEEFVRWYDAREQTG